jgi:hypothetical protein
MTLTVFDPRNGTKVTVWFPDAPLTTGPKGEVVAFAPPATPARPRRVPFQPWP